jgi:hypothetical protein
MGRAGGGCGRRRWEASPLVGSGANERERLRRAKRENEGQGYRSTAREALIGVSGS